MRNRDEARVERIAARKGMEPRRTAPLEDSVLHIDLTVKYGNGRVGVDVKGPRRFRRHDPTYMYNATWLELRNRHGLRGSLFGAARFLVVASPRGWLWIEREAVAAECVLRYIEGNNARTEGEPWWTKERGNSVIILVPYYYLYAIAAHTWPDSYLTDAYKHANNKQEGHA